MPLDDTGVWKKGKGKGRPTPKGRQVNAAALADVKALLAVSYTHLTLPTNREV